MLANKINGDTMSDTETQVPSEATTATEATTEATVENSEGQVQSETAYLDGKYKSVSDLEKGYKELQSTFSKKTSEYNENLSKYAQTQAPENYELSEGIEVNGRLENLMTFGKENGMSNEYLNKLVLADAQYQEQAQQQAIAQAKEQLGKDADTRIGNVNDWMKANLSAEHIKGIAGAVTTAEGVEAIEAIMKMNRGTAAAQVAAPKTAVDRDTIRDMRFAKDQYGGRKMQSDPHHRARVEAMEAEFIANGGKL